MDNDLEFAINVLDHIPYINNGGCAISALAIYRYLQSKNKKCKIVFCYHSYNRHRYIDNKKKIGNSCTHAVVKFENCFYDSDGEHDVSDYTYRHQVSLDIVLKAINKDVWNWDFKRKHIKRIEKQLGISLSDVKRNVH